MDKVIKIRRFLEEFEIIEKEMFHYLEYYTKKCIPGLYSERGKLEKLLGVNAVVQCIYCTSTFEGN